MNYQGDSVCVFSSSIVSNTGVTARIFRLKEIMLGKFQLCYILHNTTTCNDKRISKGLEQAFSRNAHLNSFTPSKFKR